MASPVSGDEAKKQEVIADSCNNEESINNALIKEEFDQTQDIQKPLNVNSDKETEKDPNSVQQTSCTNKHTLCLESSNEDKNSVLQPTSRATDKQSNISVTHAYTNINITEHRSSNEQLLSLSSRSINDQLLSVSNRSSDDQLLSGPCLEHQIVSNIDQCSISAQEKDKSSKRESEKCLDDDISKSSVNIVGKECSNESQVLVKESSLENKTSDKQISDESEIIVKNSSLEIRTLEKGTSHESAIIVKDSSLDNKTSEKETSHENEIEVEDLSLRNKALEILTLNENEIIVKDSSFENKRREKLNLNKIEIKVKDSSLENKTLEKETSNENETFENQSGLGVQSEEDSVGFDYSGKEEESEFTNDDNVPKSVATKLECDNKSLSKIADSEIEPENNGTGQLYVVTNVQPLESASSSCLKDGGSDKKQNQQITDSKLVACDKTVQIGQGFSSKHNFKNIQARRLKLDALVANIKSLRTAEIQDNLHDEVDASFDTPLTKVLESSLESDQDTSHYISNSTFQVKEEKKDQSECVKSGNSTLSETSESEEKIIVDKNFEKVEGQSSVLKTKIKVEDSYCCANVRVATDLNYTKAAENLNELNKSKVSEKKNDEDQDLIKNRTSDSGKGSVSNENSINEVEDFKSKALTKSGGTKNKVEDLNPNNTSNCDNASLPTDNFNTKSEIGCEDVDEDIEIDVENLDDISDNLLLFQNTDNNKFLSDNIHKKSDFEAETIKDTHNHDNESGEKSKPQFLKPPIFHFDSQGDKKISDVIGNKQAVVFLGERVTKDRSGEEANKLTKLADLSQDSNQDETSKLTKLANVKPKKPVKKIEMIRQPVRRMKRVASLNALAMVNILFGKEESPRSQKSSESKVANKKVISNKSLSKAKMLLEAKVKSILKKAKSDDQFSENVRVKKEKTSPGKITQIQKSLAKLTLDSPPSKLVTKVVSPKLLAKTSPSKSPTKQSSPCKSPSKVSSPSKSPIKISPPKSPSKVSKSPAKTKPKTSGEKNKTKNLKEAKIGKKKIGYKKEATSKISDSEESVNKKKLLSVEDKIKKPRKKKGELMRAARTHSFPEAKTKSNIASSTDTCDTSKDQNGAKCVNCQKALTGQSKNDSSNSHKQDDRSAGTFKDSNVQYNMGHVESGTYSTHSYGVIQNLTGTCVHCSQNMYSSQGPSGFIGGIMGQPGGLVSPCPTFTIGSVPMVQYHHPFSAGYPIQYQSHNTLPHCGCSSCYYYTPTASPLHHDTCHHSVPPPSYTALRDVNDPGHTGGRDGGDPKRSSLQNIGDSTHTLLKEAGASSNTSKFDEMDPEIDVVGNATSFHSTCNSLNTSKGGNDDFEVEIDVVGGVPPLTFSEKDIILETVKKKKKKENETKEKTPKSEKSEKKKDKFSTSDKENKAKNIKKRKDSEESDKNVKRKLELKEHEESDEKSECFDESPKTTKSTKKKCVSESSGEIITKPSKKKPVSVSTDDAKKVKKKSVCEFLEVTKTIKKKSTDEEKIVKKKSLIESSDAIKIVKRKSLSQLSDEIKTAKKKSLRESSSTVKKVKKKSLSESSNAIKTVKKKTLSEQSETVKKGKKKSLTESSDEMKSLKKKHSSESPIEVKNKSLEESPSEVKTVRKKSSSESPDEKRPEKKKKLSISSEETNSSKKKSPKTPTVVKGGKKKTVSKSENKSVDRIQSKPSISLGKVENKKPTKRKSTDDVFTNDSKSEAKQRKISMCESTKSFKDKLQLYNRSKSVDAKVLKDKNEISKTYPKRRRVASFDRQLSTESVGVRRKKSSTSTKITSVVTNEKKKTEIKKVKKRNHNWEFKFPPEKRKVMVSGSMVERECYPAIIHTDGDIIYIRDVVILRSGPRKTDIPYLGKVTAFWEENDEMMMGLLWYYHPEHTDSGRLPHHLQNEIFASKHRDENSVACIDDKGYVLTYNEYCRYRAEKCRVESNLSPRPMVVPVLEDNPRSQRIPVPDVDSNTVYMCRQVYDFKLKRILKNPS
ncbi:Bromo adjacent homology domain-containing 1 protein [Mytilus coruscus]|uniref:Bromo adjacent homology domain-containing 1 protein n=1 Tax=Mytilus coruscus TaxID=42192 RepID=A0A6J8A929_MYTCO|nr:Bromo adjacent homology domain-containing 1 protein [Mytilus coruscus]